MPKKDTKANRKKGRKKGISEAELQAKANPAEMAKLQRRDSRKAERRERRDSRKGRMPAAASKSSFLEIFWLLEPKVQRKGQKDKTTKDKRKSKKKEKRETKKVRIRLAESVYAIFRNAQYCNNPMRNVYA